MQSQINQVTQSWFDQNSIFQILKKAKDGAYSSEFFMPAYNKVYYHSLKSIDVVNLTAILLCTVTHYFYLGSTPKNSDAKSGFFHQAKFAQTIENKMKITFQNDSFIKIKEMRTTNNSANDKSVRYHIIQQNYKKLNNLGEPMTPYENQIYSRRYLEVEIKKEIKFEINADILFYPLERNSLFMFIQTPNIDMGFLKAYTDHHGNRIRLVSNTVRFNFMRLDPKKNGKILQKFAYRQQMNAKESSRDQYNDFGYQNKYFQKFLTALPDRQGAKRFGYYQIIEPTLSILPTRLKTISPSIKKSKQLFPVLSEYLFCRCINTKIQQLNATTNRQSSLGQSYTKVAQIDQNQNISLNLEQSYCNSILYVEAVKWSLGNILQIVVPTFLLAFLSVSLSFTSKPTLPVDELGQKIGASALIIATYISFIHTMRKSIPPTQAWSIYQVSVIILAACTLVPIFIHQTPSSGVQQNLFDNPIFIAYITVLIAMIVINLVVIVFTKLYIQSRNYQRALIGVTQDSINDSFSDFTKWSNPEVRKEFSQRIQERSTQMLFLEHQINQYKLQ